MDVSQKYAVDIFVLYGNIDQAFVNSVHVLLNFEIGGLDCRVNTTYM